MEILKKYDYEKYFSTIEKNGIDDFIEFSKTAKVLFVDADEDNRQDICSIFKIFFHDIDIATDGLDGLTHFNNNRYDLVITALDMPTMNGLEMIEKIREISRHITILVLSSEEKYFIDLIKLDVDGYILKPVEVKQFISIIQKVIEKLQDRQILYEYRINLETKIEEKTKELQDLNNHLEQRVSDEIKKNKEREEYIFNNTKLIAMGEMMRNIAHQWRQPLSSISTAASGVKLQNELLTISSDELNDNMDTIVNKANLLSQTIDTFRDFLDETKKLEEVTIEESINNSLLIIQEVMDCNDVVLINNVNTKSANKVKLMINEFSQVLLTIVNNSIDVLKNVKNPWVKIDLEEYTDKVIVTIEDNGGGISDDNIARVFEPYFTTKFKSFGIGLGLHISYKIIVENLKGKLYVKNTQNGAKFYIELPLSQEGKLKIRGEASALKN